MTLEGSFPTDTTVGQVKQTLGLDACKYAFTGAAPITVDVLEYFGALGIQINEVYGMSECTGAVLHSLTVSCVTVVVHWQWPQQLTAPLGFCRPRGQRTQPTCGVAAASQTLEARRRSLRSALRAQSKSARAPRTSAGRPTPSRESCASAAGTS